jgi:hypothetical protein
LIVLNARRRVDQDLVAGIETIPLRYDIQYSAIYVVFDDFSYSVRVAIGCEAAHRSKLTGSLAYARPFAVCAQSLDAVGKAVGQSIQNIESIGQISRANFI